MAQGQQWFGEVITWGNHGSWQSQSGVVGVWGSGLYAAVGIWAVFSSILFQTSVTCAIIVLSKEMTLLDNPKPHFLHLLVCPWIPLPAHISDRGDTGGARCPCPTIGSTSAGGIRSFSTTSWDNGTGNFSATSWGNGAGSPSPTSQDSAWVFCSLIKGIGVWRGTFSIEINASRGWLALKTSDFWC